MGVIEELYNFTSCEDKFSYTILVHSYNNEELLVTINKKLENINKNINNSYQKKFINDRINSLITHLESNFKNNDEINAIFLIDTKVNRIDLSKKDKSFCNQWKISKFIFDYDEKFNIDFLVELLSTKMVNTVFKFDKSNYSVIEMDNTKSRSLESHSSLDEDSITKMIANHKPVILYGINQILKKLSHLENNELTVTYQNMSNENVIEIIKIKNIEKNQEMFKEEFLDNLINPLIEDKLVYGKKEIEFAIKNYMIKKLFINPKMLKILKEKADASILNFVIIVVQSIKHGDYGQRLNKDYGGMVGIKYY